MENYLEINDLTNELPKNIKCHFMGHKPNTFLMNHIKNHHFDVFINLSKFEGLPVSIMESISFGIPVFATDAGGTKEIVTPVTGKLFENDINVKSFSVFLDKFFDTEFSQKNFRDNVRKYWLENFNADTNYVQFIDEQQL